MKGYIEVTNGQHYVKINGRDTYGNRWKHRQRYDDKNCFVQVNHFKWDLSVIRRLKEVVDIKKPYTYHEEYKRRRSECARDMYTALSIEQDEIELRLSQIRENFKFFGAPVGMIVTIDRAFAENGWGHVVMFIQNICLSAVDNDMGTCLQESWSIYPKTVKDFLNIPDNEVVWCGIALGYPNKEHPINNYRTSRESIEKFVTFIE